MKNNFDNTSLLWMYDIANDSPAVFGNYNPVKNEIWKLAALYIYGGFYISSDIILKVKLDDLAYQYKDDRSSPSGTGCADIVVFESLSFFPPDGNGVLGSTSTSTSTSTSSSSSSSSSSSTNEISECFVGSYHLNHQNLRSKYPLYQNAPYFHALEPNSGRLLFFHGASIANDIVLVRQPGNPMLAKTLGNMLEVFKAEYQKKSVLHIVKFENNRFQKTVLCSSYNSLMYTLIEEYVASTAAGGSGSGSGSGSASKDSPLVAVVPVKVVSQKDAKSICKVNDI